MRTKIENSEETVCLTVKTADLPTVDAGLKKALDNLWETQGATMALLKHASRQIREAESAIKARDDMIAEQERRIAALENLAMTDEMTGLFNRRGFSNDFDREISRVKRGTSKGGVFLLIDLDKFKPINDTHGHQAGDACLKLVAEALQSTVRDTDTVARFGGDEFAVLLTNTTPDQAFERIHTIRQSLNNLTLIWQGDKIDIGASMGFVKYTGDDTDFGRAYDLADKALYADKDLRRRTQYGEAGESKKGKSRG